MNLKSLIFVYLTLSLAISCSKVKFENAPSQACEMADSCIVTPQSEVFSTQVIVPQVNNKVDILFIDDNSGTMTERQQNIASRFSGFIASLNQKNLDWQIAIATTDNFSGSQEYRDGKIVPVRNGVNGPVVSGKYLIKKSDSNATQLFAGTIQRPESLACKNNPAVCYTIVSGDERGILSALKAIRNNSHGFMRDGAQLHVVILSDEDERSNGGGIPGMPLVSGEDYPGDLVSALKSTGKRAKVHSLVLTPSNFTGDVQSFNFESCVASQISAPVRDQYIGCHYIQASLSTMGVVASIDLANYTNVLSPIADDITDTSLRDYNIRCSDPNTIPVDVKAAPLAGYTYPYFFNNPQLFYVSSQTLRFNQAIPPGNGFNLTWTCPRNRN